MVSRTTPSLLPQPVFFAINFLMLLLVCWYTYRVLAAHIPMIHAQTNPSQLLIK